MKDLILDLMDGEVADIDFILSKETAFDIIQELMEDGIVLGVSGEVQTYGEAYEEIENSIAVVLSQILEEDGYSYIVSNYLMNNGEAITIDNSQGDIVIEDLIDDLVNFDKLYAENIILIGEEDEEECNKYISDDDTYCQDISKDSIIALKFKEGVKDKLARHILNQFKNIFPDNKIIHYREDLVDFEIINKI